MRGLWTKPVSFFFSCHGTKAVIARDHSVRFYRQPCGQIICKDGLRWEIRIPRLIFFNVFIFNWRIINLQYCVGFCHTSTWISHSYTYVLSLLNLPPTASYPSSCLRALGLSPLHHTADSHWLSIFHMVMSMFWCFSLDSSHPLLSPLCPQVCSLCLRLHCKQVHQYHLSRFHIYALIYHICFSLSDLLHTEH